MNEHAPGWYQHEGERRYWDGEQWTHSASVPSIPPHDAPPHDAPPHGAPSSAPPPPPAGQFDQPGQQMAPYDQPGAYGPQGGYGGQVPPFAPGGMPVARKEPALSLLASFFIPGLGQMLNGDVGIGVAFLSAYFGGWVLVLCLGWILIGFIGLPIAIGAWIWSMIDAYQGAVKFNQMAGYPG